MILPLLVLFLAGAQVEPAPADQQDVPPTYRGHWALDAESCNAPGPANMTIGARSIDFYERHGFLDLAQLNEAADPPSFYGRFRWAELLRFSTAVIRLELENNQLYVTQNDDPDAPRNTVSWTRCQK